MKRGTIIEVIAAIVLAMVALILIIILFDNLPLEGTSLAIDWRGLWSAFQHWPPLYGNATGLRIPPWDALLLAPLGLLSFGASWGVLSFFTLVVLIASVPQVANRIKRWLAIILLCTSYLSLRHMVDGNLEGLVILGALLILHGYKHENIWTLAGGMLLATAKVQEVWLLMLALAYYLIKTWSREQLLRLTAVLAIVVIPTMLWLGREWLLGATAILERGSIMDSGLWSAMGRLQIPIWVAIPVWGAVLCLVVYVTVKSQPQLSPEKIAMLIAASLLLAPYAAGNSVLTVVAIGVIPLLVFRSPIGIALITLVNLPYFFSRDFAFQWSAYYWTLYLALVVFICATILFREEIQIRSNTLKEITPAHDPT